MLGRGLLWDVPHRAPGKASYPSADPTGSWHHPPSPGGNTHTSPQSAGGSAVRTEAGSRTQHLTSARHPPKYPKIWNVMGLPQGF